MSCKSSMEDLRKDIWVSRKPCARSNRGTASYMQKEVVPTMWHLHSKPGPWTWGLIRQYSIWVLLERITTDVAGPLPRSVHRVTIPAGVTVPGTLQHADYPSAPTTGRHGWLICGKSAGALQEGHSDAPQRLGRKATIFLLAYRPSTH
jgi:hypothetical protein